MNDKLEDKNLETTLNEENAKLLNNINGKENISGIMATEKELENYNEILSFLKEELKVQEKSKFLKTLWNLVFIMGVVGTLFLFFQCINGQLGRIESISLVTFSIGDIIILMINNSIYTDSILVIKRQITDLENRIVPALEQKLEEEKVRAKTLEANKSKVKVEAKKEEVTIQSDCSLNDNFKEQKGKSRSLKLIPKNDNK